ncbi:MAG: hypothetical protein JWQ35_2606 [Bacteriovoracaceae bacterium]|nr:hypothetical protein [Bacteriovoracaceae bacterium]
MGLNSLQTDAFLAIARTQSFSEAAKQLHVTQSALSQRINNLESDLGQTLFIRKSSGILPTEAGRKFLKYCQIKSSLEEELIQNIKGKKTGEFGGTLRLAAYSSVMRSVIMPALLPFLRKHPGVQCEFITQNIRLPDLLQRSEVDFIVMDHPFSSLGVQTKSLGHEVYIAVESEKYDSPDDIYLDNDPTDMATEIFFAAQENVPKYRRSYFSDVYGILNGVSAGLGRAVVSKHLIKPNTPVRVLKKYHSLKVEVSLHYHDQPFYSQLHSEVIEQLVKNCPQFL